MSARSAHFLGCRVVSGNKSLAHAGAADVICTEVQQAVARSAPGAHYNAEVAVLSPSRLTATITVNGRTLPLQNFAVMDGRLTEESIKRFAASVAAAVADAVKP